MTAPTIHFRRRWYYVLWTALLLLSAGALALWERPVATDSAAFVLKLRVAGAPAGTRVQVWAGPQARWPGQAWQGEGAFAQEALPGDGALALPVLRVPIARRRWVRDYIPRGTSDLIMVRFLAPGAPPRFLAVPLSQDIRLGALRPKWKLATTVALPWEKLDLDGRAPNRLP
jgi:hypothetical protein